MERKKSGIVPPYSVLSTLTIFGQASYSNILINLSLKTKG